MCTVGVELGGFWDVSSSSSKYCTEDASKMVNHWLSPQLGVTESLLLELKTHLQTQDFLFM